MFLRMFLARERARQVLPAAVLPTTVPHPAVHSDLPPVMDVVIRAHRPIQKAVLPVIRRQGMQIGSLGCPALALQPHPDDIPPVVIQQLCGGAYVFISPGAVQPIVVEHAVYDVLWGLHQSIIILHIPGLPQCAAPICEG